MASREAQFAVWLLDPGPDPAGVLAVVQELLTASPAAAAQCLEQSPALVSYYERETAARHAAARLKELGAVATVRPADRPLASVPAIERDVHPWQRRLTLALAVLGALQIAVAGEWFREQRDGAGSFGMMLGVIVLIYCGVRLRR